MLGQKENVYAALLDFARLPSMMSEPAVDGMSVSM